MSLRDLFLAKMGYEERVLEGVREVKDAVMIRVDGAISVTGKNGRLVWVQDLQTTQVFVARNPGIQLRNGLPVLIAPTPKSPHKWRITEVDWDRIDELQGYDGSPFFAEHHPDHEWPTFKPGADVVTVYPRAYSELRTQAYGGLEVQVSAYTYVKDGQFTQYPGEVGVDLSAYQPAAGLARWVLVGLDKDTNALDFVAGDTGVDVYTQWPPFPTVPTSMEVSALVRLDGSQTEFGEVDMFDVRQLLGTGSATVTSASAAWTLPMCNA